MSKREASDQLVVAMAITIEVCGTKWTKETMSAVLTDLVARFSESAIHDALSRCRYELKGALTLADIVERIDDGRPGPDEAWAQVGALDEQRSLVATEEAMEAWGEVRGLLESDETGARMAFRDAYRRIVARNRTEGVPVKWIASLGHDKAGHEGALREAADQGRLEGRHAAMIAGHASNDPKALRAELAAGEVKGFLPSGPAKERTGAMFGSILAAMGNPEEMRRLQEELERKAAEEERRRDMRARAAGER